MSIGHHPSVLVEDPTTGARKADGDKIRVDLLPIQPLMDIASVLTYGASKYTPRNWEAGFAYSRIYGAALRHIMAWWNGEDLDPESGLPHLAHATCCLLFLMEYTHTGAGQDDRPNRHIMSAQEIEARTRP